MKDRDQLAILISFYSDLVNRYTHILELLVDDIEEDEDEEGGEQGDGEEQTYE